MGQGGGAAAKGVPFESANNVLAAVVAWVETGTAVQDIVGTKFVDDSVELGVDYQHRHCKYECRVSTSRETLLMCYRYPARSTYLGGDPKALSSWECRDEQSC